jgi:hypothetical protein
VIEPSIAEVFAKLRYGAGSDWSTSFRPAECALMLAALDDEFVGSLAAALEAEQEQTAKAVSTHASDVANRNEIIAALAAQVATLRDAIQTYLRRNYPHGTDHPADAHADTLRLAALSGLVEPAEDPSSVGTSGDAPNQEASGLDARPSENDGTREVDGTPSEALCECGHPARLHHMASAQPDCFATIYTDAPIGGGSCFPCRCRFFVAASEPLVGERASGGASKPQEPDAHHDESSPQACEAGER